MRLEGKIALITGGSRGIGRAVAEAFGREGASLFITGQRDQQALDESLAALRTDGLDVDGGLFDVGRHDEVARMAEAIDQRFGALDILVNNAGGIKMTPLLDKAPEEIEETVRAHLMGTIFCMQIMVNRFMRHGRGGKIINITSPAGMKPTVGLTDYGAAKAGIALLTRTAAKELLPLNIQVNCVLPVAETRMTEVLIDFERRTLGNEAPGVRRTRPAPQILAPTFLFFASADSDYVTGQILAADGGAHL